MTKTEARKILKITKESIEENIKKKIIKTNEKGKIIDESVYEYLKELEERKKIKKPIWIKHGQSY